MVESGIQSFCSLDCLYSRKKKGPSGLSKKKIPPQVRATIKERDGSRCAMCWSDRRVPELHHIVYRSEGGKHTEENLISLCSGCHREVHSNKRKWQALCLETVKRLNKGKRINVRMVEREINNAGVDKPDNN